MNRLGLFFQVLTLICSISLNSQSVPSRILVFPALENAHFSPVLTHDGSKLFFSIIDNPINVGISKQADIWISEKEINGNWSKPYPIPGDINTELEERAVSITEQSNCILIKRPLDKNSWNFYDFNERSWLLNESFSIPTFLEKSHFNAFNSYKTVCIFGGGNAEKNMVLISVLDSTLSWSKPNVLIGFENFKNIRNVTISVDNKTIYFSAESEENNYGGFDIYRSQRLGSGWMNWSKPQNLGLGVNSLLDEYEPTVAEDGKRLIFTVRDSDDKERIYQSLLMDTLQAEKAIGITTRGELFSKRNSFSGEIRYYGANQNSKYLSPINLTSLSFHLPAFLPQWDYILESVDYPDYFIPSIQLAIKSNKNPYLTKIIKKASLGEFESEYNRLARQLMDKDNILLDIQTEINNHLQKIQIGKLEIWKSISELPAMDLKPIENELKIWANSYALTLKLSEKKDTISDRTFTEGAERIQFWKNEYDQEKEKREDEEVIQNFQQFLSDVVRYVWFVNQLEFIREIEKEFELEAFEKISKSLIDKEIDFPKSLLDESYSKLKATPQHILFQGVSNEYSKQLIWPLKNKLQLPFFNEISLRVKPLVEREMLNQLKMPMVDLLGLHYYLYLLKEKKQVLWQERKSVTLILESLILNAKKQENNLFIKDSISFESLKIVRDTQINLIAYPFDYPELIALDVPFFHVDSVEADIFGIFELNRILKILSEYPGLGIEMAIQVSGKGTSFSESRDLGILRKGYIDAFFEQVGIGLDRRNIYILESKEIINQNKFPIQVLIRFFYRS